MKKQFIIIAIIINCQLTIVNSNAQSLSPKANPTSGGYYSAGGNSLSWTEGETYNTTLTSVNNMLTQGEQQPEINIGGCISAPAIPGAISGPPIVCQMNTASYSVAPVNGATGYFWTVPGGMVNNIFQGMIITSGQGTNSITVSITSGTVLGNITVNASNACGTSASSALAITKKPGATGPITATSLCGNNTATYTIAPVTGATSYNWTVANGLTIIGPLHGTTITVSKSSSFIVGNVSAMAVNACGFVSGTTITVYGKVPVAPAPIVGSVAVCPSSGSGYSTAGSTGATSYTWSITGNATVTGSGINATVNFGAGFTTGTLSVTASNPCGNSNTRTLSIKAINCFSAPILADNSEETKSTLFNLYPNPIANAFTMDILSESEKEIEIQLYDVMGKLVNSTNIIAHSGTTSIQTNMENFNNGIYFIKVTDKEMKTLYTQRLIKQ